MTITKSDWRRFLADSRVTSCTKSSTGMCFPSMSSATVKLWMRCTSERQSEKNLKKNRRANVGNKKSLPPTLPFASLMRTSPRLSLNTHPNLSGPPTVLPLCSYPFRMKCPVTLDSSSPSLPSPTFNHSLCLTLPCLAPLLLTPLWWVSPF